ncbi:type III secretion system protein SctP [Paraburkholderia youngii]|uniref:type III secretion system protein SctP n=1 Tax=Paraburkholderia youngii TaxID=2782701 RepID=UPI003D1D4061
MLVRRTRSLGSPVSFEEPAPEAQADRACQTSALTEGGVHAIPFDDGEARDSSGETEAAAAAALGAHKAPLQCLPAATMPAVDALFRTQGKFLELARDVATFCVDPAISDAGSWEVRIPLDARILPDTTLYLSLSRFWLSLRFDARSIETRQLLFDHSAMLEREVGALLDAWATPRNIELTVW